MRHHRGFTLFEAILVIAITGIIAGMVTVFLRAPIDAYLDTARRAEMTDIADTALRRIARDLRRAVPNTVRTTTVAAGGKNLVYLEFIPAKAGGRYVADDTCFSTGCASLVTMGSLVDEAAVPPVPMLCRDINVPAGSGCLGADRLVIYNQYNNAFADCAADNPSAYCDVSTHPALGAYNSRAIDQLNVPAGGGDADQLYFASTRFVPENGSATGRLQIAEGPVTFVCDPVRQEIRRYSGYALTAAQPTPPTGAAPTTATGAGLVQALLASRVEDCNFRYDEGAFSRWGLIVLQVTLANQGERVALYQEVHVDNAP